MGGTEAAIAPAEPRAAITCSSNDELRAAAVAEEEEEGFVMVLVPAATPGLA